MEVERDKEKKEGRKRWLAFRVAQDPGKRLAKKPVVAMLLSLPMASSATRAQTCDFCSFINSPRPDELLIQRIKTLS
jgi:hypothetical protein